MANTDSNSSSKTFNQESEERTTIQYKECWRNHAVLIGGYAADGCGEFIPKGGQALLGSHHIPTPLGWRKRDVHGSYPFPSALSQPSFSPGHHHYHYSQKKMQDMVSDEESVFYSGSQGEMEMKASKRTKRETL
ncbi:zinc-finger homeodomain protein 5 [Ricinus communis]|uniref:zinc-finger homeodomain protein 5 n=1 Tax=Ricinus communis TaxID=3988 RepID=UPI0007725DC8|nr:zinc-finger homeodomain protein 5 [Ricinus communis]|eukprot:XP_015576566.1 zinc-finger homeodomain protein 5 [Ricinus communis]